MSGTKINVEIDQPETKYDESIKAKIKLISELKTMVNIEEKSLKRMEEWRNDYIIKHQSDKRNK